MNSNQKIAKNTIYLYMRILINLLLGIYSSRVVLQTLGVEDYGIYNIVGGVVVLFSFLNDSLQAATQRFLNYEMGKNDAVEVKNIFQTAILIHLFLGVIVLILSETIGLYVVQNQLKLPIERYAAATIVYQLSIFCTLVGIIRVPFNALIIAYEKMSFYAYLSIIETSLKLVTIFCLLYIGYDKLILYSLVILFIVTLITICYIIYCHKTIKCISLIPKKHNEIFRKMLSFTGWTLFGGMANVTAAQGVSICMNHFLGVLINAGIGIANQLNGIVYQFVSNLQLAFNPSLVQYYSSGEFDKLKSLLFKSSRYSFYLLLIIALPLMLNSDFVLYLWLGSSMPSYSSIFLKIILICSFFDAISGPLWVTVQAAGHIKKYQLIISSIIFFNLPLVYLILKFGGSPFLAYSVGILIRLTITMYRVFFLSNIKVFEIKDYVVKVFFPIFLVFVFSFFLTWLVRCFWIYTNTGMLMSILLVVLHVIITMFVVVSLGMTQREREVLFCYINKIIRKLK